MNDDPEPVNASDAIELSSEPIDLSTVLHDAALDPAGPTLGDLTDGVGTRAHGVLLFLLALPEAIPLPIPSLSWVVGVPLLLVALHLLAYGERTSLPERVRRVEVPQRAIVLADRALHGPLRRLEATSPPRWDALVRQPLWAALAAVALAVVMLLPIPFVNAPPALALCLVAWGLVRGDGLVLLAGLAATVLLLATLLGAAIYAWTITADG